MFMPIATIVSKLCTVKFENSVNVQSAPFVKSGHIIIIIIRDLSPHFPTCSCTDRIYVCHIITIADPTLIPSPPPFSFPAGTCYRCTVWSDALHQQAEPRRCAHQTDMCRNYHRLTSRWVWSICDYVHCLV